MKDKKKILFQRGFSLIELTIAILITGIILGIIASAITSFNDQITTRKNREIIESIQDELNRFLEVQGRYPCPASLTQEISNINFGVEAHEDCNNNTIIDGVFQTTGRNSLGIKIGAVPIRTLNLPDEYIFDAHKTRFLYAVTQRLANSSTYERDEGAISIVDSNNNSTTIPPNSSPFVLLSFGENSIGGYDGISGLQIGNGCINLSSLETENCDHDGVFVKTILQSESGEDYFDDNVLTRLGSGLNQAVPAGGIMFFNLSECPLGWQDFLSATPPNDTIACQKI